MGLSRMDGWGKRFGLLVLVLMLACSTAYAQRGADIQHTLAEIESGPPIQAALAAERALRSNDPLLRSMALEKALSNDDSRVRSIGFTYLVSTLKRIVVEATATESALRSVGYEGDRKQLIDQLVLVVEFSDFDAATGRFKARVNRWGSCDGAIGQDGITITAHYNKLTLRQAVKRTLVGTASYRLSNQPGLINLPAAVALP